MSEPISGPSEKEFMGRVVDTVIRVGLIILLVLWCLEIVRPFIIPVLWGIIIAIAVFPGFQRLERGLGGRSTLAATLLSLLGLIVIIGPTILLAETLYGGASGLAGQFGDGTINIPPPPESVATWPVIGPRLAELWKMASQNLGSLLSQFTPQLQAAATWLLSAAADAGLGVLQFVFAIVIAGVFMAKAEGGGHAANAIAKRIVGPRGPEYADLANATIRGVTRGILGVALIQAILAGLGFLAVGLPAAGLWALVCLILAVVQIGVGPVMIPAAIYVFYTSDVVAGVLFAIWTVGVIVSDNILKPLLLGRGARVPMLIVFLGAIGGFLAFGIIGLFVGAIVLSLGYTLFVAWLGETSRDADEVPDVTRGSQSQ